MLQFEPISLSKANEYTSLYQQCGERSADNTFSNLWGWTSNYQYEWAFDNDLCWLRHKKGDAYYYNTPAGNWKFQDWAKLIQEKLPPFAEMDRIPEALALKLHLACGDKIKLVEQPDQWEYVYDVEQLINLDGPKYHTKRQLANHFINYYDTRYADITPTQFPDIIKFQKSWMKNEGRDKEPLIISENEAILKILHDWDKLPVKLFGSILYVDDKIAAYTIGEELDSQKLMVHFEKASLEYKGAYQAINRTFLQHHDSYKYVNREQDLGIPGLRRAKQDYHPCIFIKKYHIHKVD